MNLQIKALRTATPLELGFDYCDKDSCVARMKEGKLDDAKGGFINLLRSFQSEDYI